MTAAAGSGDYFLEIESHFAMRRGTPFILSAKDWLLMKKWEGEGVPLAVVIEAIDQVFEKNETSGRRKVISSLSYCRHAVKEIWDQRRELHIRDGDAVPEENVEELLAALADDIETSTAPADIAAPFVAEVRGLVREKSVPRIEERLIEIERQLIEQLAEGASEAERLRLEKAVESAVGTSKLEGQILRRTADANLRRTVRERYSLPRLTLFR